MKKSKALIFGLLLAVIAVSGALASPGKPAPFESGKTTLKQVEQALGEPNARTIDAGQKTVCYSYAGLPSVPQSFMRITGAASRGEADLTCCFRFTPDGVLEGVAPEGKGQSCPPPMLQPGMVVHLPQADHH